MKKHALVILLCIVCLTACVFYSGDSAQTPIRGYLSPDRVPNSVTLLPAPPSAGSTALLLDEEINKESLAWQKTSRFALAGEDADLGSRGATNVFSCALKIPITEMDTPRLATLLRRTLYDAAESTLAAKEHYKRVRPFIINRQPTCRPADEKMLAGQGSYPSGHAAVGWVWALILSEIAPDRADAILARGRAFGESRIVCNVHWQSDIVEGRTMGAAVVAVLHGNETFRHDLELAKAELSAARKKDLSLLRDCAAEAEILAGH